MQCNSNLKILALPCHEYADTYQTFPPGCIWAYPDESLINSPVKLGKWSWTALLLPYFEQEPLHAQIGVNRLRLPESLLIPANLSAMQRRIPTLRPTHFENSRQGMAQPAMSNHVALNGSGELRREPGSPAGLANGIFVMNQGFSFNDVLDGTSNTGLIGERAFRFKVDGGGFRDLHGASAFGVRGVRQNSEQGLADALGCGRIKINFTAGVKLIPLSQSLARRGFSSLHPGGAQFASADGSVRFISETNEADMSAAQVLVTENVVDSVWEAYLGKDDGVSRPMPE